jgi:hypothetical protein
MVTPPVLSFTRVRFHRVSLRWPRRRCLACLLLCRAPRARARHLDRWYARRVPY